MRRLIRTSILFLLILTPGIIFLNSCKNHRGGYAPPPSDRGKIVESKDLDSTQLEKYAIVEFQNNLKPCKECYKNPSTYLLEIWDQASGSGTGQFKEFEVKCFPEQFKFGANPNGDLVEFRNMNDNKVRITKFIMKAN